MESGTRLFSSPGNGGAPTAGARAAALMLRPRRPLSIRPDPPRRQRVRHGPGPLAPSTSQRVVCVECHDQREGNNQTPIACHDPRGAQRGRPEGGRVTQQANTGRSQPQHPVYLSV